MSYFIFLHFPFVSLLNSLWPSLILFSRNCVMLNKSQNAGLSIKGERQHITWCCIIYTLYFLNKIIDHLFIVSICLQYSPRISGIAKHLTARNFIAIASLTITFCFASWFLIPSLLFIPHPLCINLSRCVCVRYEYCCFKDNPTWFIPIC